jgi:L-cysteine desulfidase
MSGCAMPVVICCGSGNQGITCSMPVLEYAHELWASHEQLVRAVALSDLTAVHVKYYIGELSAFCGAVSAACGAGAGICLLRGGNFDQFEATVVNTLVNVGGIVCDGAKPSCAAKISAAVDAAILGCDQALTGVSFKPGDGLVGDTPEESIRAMGYVGRVGMQPTDIEILNIMIGKTEV